MLKMEDFLMIRDLHHQGLNISQIARETGFNRRTIRRRLEAEVPPMPQKRARKPGKLADYTEYIQRRITDYPLRATRIYREIQEMGYTGKYTIVKDYIRSIRPPEGTSAVLRFETHPGVQAQVDWAECGYLDVDEHPRTVYCFSIILGYSRMRFMEFTLATDVYTLIPCHLHAFDYFGGYTEEILYDNIKTVILKRAIRAGDHQWNVKFEDFFAHLGFIPRVCKPYCPQTKGKIENSIGFMKRDFLLGSTFTSLEDMNRELRRWCDRVNAEPHGTTHEIPFDRLQQENLQSLTNSPPYLLRREERRKISREAYVSYQGNRYSVPYRYAGREAVLELQDSRMDVRIGTGVICTHRVVPGHGRVIREKEHFAGLLAEAMRCNARCSRKTSRPLFTMATPEVEHRSLAVYDAFADEVHP